MQFLEHPALGRLPAHRVLDCVFALTPTGTLLHLHIEQVAGAAAGAAIQYRLTGAPPAAGRERCRVIPPRVREFPSGLAPASDAPPVLRALGPEDTDAALDVINAAARWYREFLPPEELHEPEMTRADFEAEARRMAWYGAFSEGRLLGVMGLEYVRDAALLRHAYILPEAQRRGIGSRLGEHLERRVTGVTRIIVGTYRGNYRARAALEKAGYRLSPNSDEVLRAYYAIPDGRRKSSVTYERDVSAPNA